MVLPDHKSVGSHVSQVLKVVNMVHRSVVFIIVKSHVSQLQIGKEYCRLCSSLLTNDICCQNDYLYNIYYCQNKKWVDQYKF